MGPSLIRDRLVPSKPGMCLSPCIAEEAKRLGVDAAFVQQDGPITVVQFSNDELLGRSRELLLTAAGCTTRTIGSHVPICEREFGSLRVALFCQSVEISNALEIASTMQRWGRRPWLLRIAMANEVLVAEKYFDALLFTPVDPVHLQQQVSRMARRPMRIQAK
jgi:hypothetical protein